MTIIGQFPGKQCELRHTGLQSARLRRELTPGEPLHICRRVGGYPCGLHSWCHSPRGVSQPSRRDPFHIRRIVCHPIPIPWPSLRQHCASSFSLARQHPASSALRRKPAT